MHLKEQTHRKLRFISCAPPQDILSLPSALSKLHDAKHQSSLQYLTIFCVQQSTICNVEGCGEAMSQEHQCQQQAVSQDA